MSATPKRLLVERARSCAAARAQGKADAAAGIYRPEYVWRVTRDDYKAGWAEAAGREIPCAVPRVGKDLPVGKEPTAAPVHHPEAPAVASSDPGSRVVAVPGGVLS